ncbi:pentatricopeptide repeat-containing protein At1g62260, mitochondrial [Euphorbia lathyris]|uniref:pentatricopeptide repeat-containing protein At1g62260, mitochondrial n=1 Tax=Euphorbia lathyris TaxID=212925 RepID=UPI003313EED0
MIRRLNLEFMKSCNRKLGTRLQLFARAENRCFVSTATSKRSFQDMELYSLNKKIVHFARIGQINDARTLFDKMERRNTVTWNSMITSYVNRREITKARKLFDAMPQRDVVSWNLMISAYVLSCRGRKFVEVGRYLFDHMPERSCVSWNTMISGYCKNGMMEEALQLFNSMPERNSISCNAIVTGFLQNGNVLRAIEFFETMPERNASSLNVLVAGLIQNGELDKAARISLKYGENDSGKLLAYNTLIAGYGQRGRVNEARSLFDQIPFYGDKGRESGGRFERNLMSWNTMMMCYVKAEDIVSARELFDQMTERDTFSWNTMINGYVLSSNMEEALNLFSEMPNPDTVSWNSMISGYALKGNLECAHDFFQRMPCKNLISWNSIIAAYEKNEDYEGAVELFIRMQMEGEKPDQHTLSSLLGVSSGIVDVRLGLQIHQLVIKTVIPDVPLNNAIITMYSKCGAITVARSIFYEMGSHKEVRSWNAMIGGYASHGYATEAFELFKLMRSFNVRPTYITFISVLNACSNVGLVDEACQLFKSMAEYGIKPGIEHFASLVDNLGRHGQLEDALNLINSMPVEPDKTVWGALLNASRVHNNLEMAQVAAKALMRIEPDSSVPYVLLYNMYVDVGQWENASNIRTMMEKNNIKKEAALSWVGSS